jgi:hypothetical protein
VGAVVGAVLGIALLAAVATVYIIYRRRRGPIEHQRKSIQLNSLPSGRTAEHSDVEDPFDEKNGIDGEMDFGGKPNGNGIRYLEDDDQDLNLPSARLNPL